jgi:hypothetical protein
MVVMHGWLQPGHAVPWLCSEGKHIMDKSGNLALIYTIEIGLTRIASHFGPPGTGLRVALAAGDRPLPKNPFPVYSYARIRFRILAATGFWRGRR